MSQSGIERADVIDFIGHNPVTDTVTLGMVETRPWSGSDLQLFQLQEKLNAYLSFALDGEMTDAYPHFVEKAIRLQIDCIEPPDQRTIQMLALVREQIAFRGIDLEVRVMGKAACGPSCECGNSQDRLS